MPRYIDADELLRRLSRDKADEGALFVAFVKKVVEMRIDDMPTADVAEVKRGRWTSQEYMSEIDSFIYTEYICSNCGEISKKKSNYCPNCGAKMGISYSDRTDYKGDISYTNHTTPYRKMDEVEE